MVKASESNSSPRMGMDRTLTARTSARDRRVATGALVLGFVVSAASKAGISVLQHSCLAMALACVIALPPPLCPLLVRMTRLALPARHYPL